MLYRHRIVFALLLSSTIVFGLMFSSFMVDVFAQDDSNPNPTATPSPIDLTNYAAYYESPVEIVGDATWTLSDFTFESLYPDGFAFTVVATSSGGDITNASVQWSHVANRQRRQTAEHNPETGVFSARWDGQGSIPPWVAVNYRWSFTDSAGNTYRTAWIMGEEYSDNSTQWQRYESEDAIVFTESGLPNNTGNEILKAMTAQRETYRQAWGDVLPYKPRAIIFSSRSSFIKWQVNTMQSNTAITVGLTSDEWGGTAQFFYGGLNELAWGVVLHEVGHLYQGIFAPAGFPSGTWWIEGNATLFEIDHGYDIIARVRRLASRGQLPALLEGTGPGPFSRAPDGQIRYGYDVGFTFWYWIVENYGWDSHRAIIQRIRLTSYSRNGALEEVLGMPADQIEREWRTWLGADPVPPTVFPTEPYRFPPTVTPFIRPTSASQ